ncbi:7742_t:CDS:2, partial [Entrophospora sp. SA101]
QIQVLNFMLQLHEDAGNSQARSYNDDEWIEKILILQENGYLCPSKYRPNALYDTFTKLNILGTEHFLALERALKQEPKLQPYDVMEVMKLPKEFPDNYWQFHDNSGHGMINYINKQNPLELFNVKATGYDPISGMILSPDGTMLASFGDFAIIEEVLSIKSVTFKEENYYIGSSQDGNLLNVRWRIIGCKPGNSDIDNINYDEENGPALYGEYRNWTSEEITIFLKYNLELC